MEAFNWKFWAQTDLHNPPIFGVIEDSGLCKKTSQILSGTVFSRADVATGSCCCNSDSAI